MAPATRGMLVLAALFACAAPFSRAHADGPSMSACIGAGCEFASGPAARTACAAAATTPETYHRAFERGCLARRDFSARSDARETPRRDANAGSVLDPVRLPSVDVVGVAEPDDASAPTLESRFAATLVRGNPEVAGGKMRHGAYYAHGMYWGADPLTFLYYNLRYGLAE